MSQTTVSTDLFQSLEVLTELGINTVRQDLGVLAVNDIFLSVQKPRRNLELSGILNNSDNSLKLIRVEVSSAV